MVGCGNIGFRYYEALIKLNLNICLYIFDNQKEKYSKFLNSKNNKLKIVKISSLQKLKKKIDLVIISTTSDVRVEILKRILKLAKVKKIILEKTLCQSIKELKTLNKLNKKFNLNSWISSPKPTWLAYLILKTKINYKKNKSFSVDIIGSNWGFASNIIHHLHLIDYIFKSPKIISTSLIENGNWFKTKRKNFFDTHGVYKVFYDNFSSLTLTDNKDTKLRNWKMLINYNNQKIIVDELRGKIFIRKKKFKFKAENLSDNYEKVLKKILFKNTSNLPNLESSINKHFYLIKDFLVSWNSYIKSKKNKILPVT